MVTGIIGKKVGMTQVFDADGTVHPATVIKAGPCVVTQVRTPSTDGYNAVQIAFGAIDPRTLTIHEYVLPANGARPRRLAIDASDIIWYSDYARGYLGRFDPASGDAREWASPGGPASRPYGITVLNGVVWYSESGVQPNTLVRFDPKSGTFQTWPIPSGGGVVRNMMPRRDHGLVLAESGVGKLALVDIH